MTMTIKELADELGVSKQAIRKHLEKLPPTLVVTRVNRTIQLDTDVADFVRSRVTVVTSNVDTEVTGKVTTEDYLEILKRVNLLENQIAVKDKQLDVKDEQLTHVHKLLDQQQVLTLQANKKIAELETTVKNDEEQTPVEKEMDKSLAEIREAPKKSFFDRLFNR